MKIKFIGLTDKGRIREHNEDSYLAGDKIYTSLDRGGEDSEVEIEVQNTPILFAVADGMGGHEGGEVASSMTLELLREKCSTIKNVIHKSILENLINEIHKEVNENGLQMNKPDMGTTLSGCIISREQFFIFNVGDSRVYRFRGGYLQQITRDHSLKSELNIDAPKNIITNCIGGGLDEIYVDIFDYSTKMNTGDGFLIITDGITDSLNEDDIEKCLNEQHENCAEFVHSLVLLSLDQGSKDNVTAIYLKITP